jgi:hypothetical protein
MLVIIGSYSSPYWRSGISSTSENLISDVMVSKLAPSVVDLGFETRSSRTKDYKICICCFSTKHAELRSKRKDWLDRNPNYMCEWGHMSIRGLLFQWASTIQNPTACWSSTKWTSSSHWKLICSRHYIVEKLLIWHQIIITH